MQQWICAVCGYIHGNETSPIKCPQCGADGNRFEPKRSED